MTGNTEERNKMVFKGYLVDVSNVLRSPKGYIPPGKRTLENWEDMGLDERELHSIMFFIDEESLLNFFRDMYPHAKSLRIKRTYRGFRVLNHNSHMYFSGSIYPVGGYA